MLKYCARTALATTAICLAVGAMAQDLQNRPAPSTQGGATQPAAPRENFRAYFDQFNRIIEQLRDKDIPSATRRLDDVSKATPEERMQEVEGLKDSLVQLGEMLQPDRPFSQSIDRFEDWTGAQVSRLNQPSQRESLGPEFVEQRLRSYRANQTEVSRAREFLNTQRKSVNQTLRELTVAQLRFSELLLSADSDNAVKELKDTLAKIGKALEDIQQQIRQYGTSGV